jgi:hypothetical protein
LAVPEKYSLVKRLDHGVLVGGVDVARAIALTEPEDGLNDRELSRCSVETCMSR